MTETTIRTCECGKPVVARGLCHSHYRKVMRSEPDGGRLRKAATNRFLDSISHEGECWIWAAALDNGGRPKIWCERTFIPAKRFAYETFIGPLPTKWVKSACGNVLCVNPEHLKVSTHLVGDEETKPCSKCRKVKPRSEFTVDGGYLRGPCKECESKRDHGVAQRKAKAKKYGLSLDDYEQMLAAQGGVCAICQRPETFVTRGTVSSLGIDHDHETGVVRGLLCRLCNAGIGGLQDSPELLERAAEYLRGYEVSP